MKQIFNNKYVKSFKFISSHEFLYFSNKQIVPRKMFIEESYGDYYYCYIIYNSLNGEKLFAISFNSDEKEDDLNMLFWNEAGLIVIDTGRKLYFIDNQFDIKFNLEITTPLIGLCLTEEKDLLILEEASFKLLNSEGKVLKNEIFDLIIDFNIENNCLHVVTSEEDKTFKLT